MSIPAAPVLFKSLDVPRGRERIATIGTFDGVHRGHQALIAAAIARGHTLGLPTTAITFEPVPASVLRPDKFQGRVCSADEKFARLSSCGLDEIVTLTFDRAFAGQTPEEFMAAVSSALGLTELWVGEAFALGKNRAGDVQRLTEIGRELGFAVSAMPRLEDDGHIISSSGIRTAVIEGDVARAHRGLGRPFRVSGVVVPGAKLGRTIGYPTANVVPPADLVPLADGIYVTETRLQDETLARPSMTYVGTRPTVNSGERLIETHLLDFDADLYGSTIAVDFQERLRGDATFTGLEALVAQLNQDEAATRAYFGSHGSGSDDDRE